MDKRGRHSGTLGVELAPSRPSPAVPLDRHGASLNRARCREINRAHIIDCINRGNKTHEAGDLGARSFWGQVFLIFLRFVEFS